MQAEIVLNGKNIVVQVDPSQKIFPHFSILEMSNPSAKELTKLVITDNVIKHGELVEAFRVFIGKPFPVNSWYRTKSFNKSVGGIDGSYHCAGTATDIPFADAVSQFDYYSAIWKMLCEAVGCVGECILYSESKFIHFASFTSHKVFYKAIKKQ